MKKIFSSKRGEMYMDQVITILVITAFMLLAISTLSVASTKSTADAIADTLLEVATVYGCFGTEFDEKVLELQELYPGLEFTVEVDGEWFNTELQRVHYGDTMWVIVNYNAQFSGFGTTVSIPLRTVRTGASENYWKDTVEEGS